MWGEILPINVERKISEIGEGRGGLLSECSTAIVHMTTRSSYRLALSSTLGFMGCVQ